MNFQTMELDWNDFQRAHWKWSKKNFGEDPANAWRPLVGIMEEIGELSETMSRNAGGKIFVDLHGRKTFSDAMDAVGDIMIYLSDFGSRNEIKISETLKYQRWIGGKSYKIVAGGNGGIRYILEAGSSLCHAYLKNVQGIRCQDQEKVERAIQLLILETQRFCAAHSFDFDRCVLGAWGIVSKRNWKKNQEDGCENN